MNLSANGRAQHLLEYGRLDFGTSVRVAKFNSRTARSINVPFTLPEAQAATKKADVKLMMAPVLVTLAHSPLALLGNSYYGSSAYTSRVPLLEV